MDARDLAGLAAIFKALGDPTRLTIFELIRSNVAPSEGHSAAEIDESISQIASQFDLSLSTVSHHVKELRRAGLIRCTRRGQSIYCSVEPSVVEMVSNFLGTAGRTSRSTQQVPSTDS